MEAHEIVAAVHEAYPQLPRKASRINGKTEEIYRSHHREPKTRNPEASGNVSPVTLYMEYVRLYEAVEPGSGMMLDNRVHHELQTEFAESSVIHDNLPASLADKIGCDAHSSAELVTAIQDGVIDGFERKRIEKAIKKQRDNLDLIEAQLSLNAVSAVKAVVNGRSK